MKNIIFKILLLYFICLSVFQVYSQNNYKVSFYIHDYEDSIIYISGYCGSKNDIMDSVKIAKDGGFHWSAIDYPMGIYMIKSTKGDMFSFVLETSKDFSIETYQNGEFFIKNCPENDAYFLYQKENKICQTAIYYYKINASQNIDKADSLKKEDIMKIINDFQAFQESFFKTYPLNIITVITDGMNQTAPAYFFENGNLKKGMELEYATYYRQHYWDRFHFKDIRILYTPYFIKQFNTYISEITIQQPDTVCKAIDEFISVADKNGGKEYADYIIAWYLDNLPQLPFSFNEIIYSHIVKTYCDRASTYLMPSLIEFHKQNISRIEPLLPGNIMPNVVLNDFNNKKHSLYSLKNRYTVVYFFSTTCESCKKNLDDLKEFYNQYKDKYDVEIFSIDIEPDYALCKARQETEPFAWIVTHATSDELKPYNFNLDHTPELFILDKNKRIINKTAIYEHIQQTIENDIKNNSK